MDSFFPAKLQPPQLPARVISRHRLVERLHEHLDRRLTLVSAPAGYGKTTLLADFARDAQFPVAWLSLDASDRDLTTFASHLVGALQRPFPRLGARTLTALGGSDLNPRVVATAVVSEIDEYAADFFVLVLDDYHEVDDADAVNEVVDLLLANLPDHCRLVLASRTIPGQLHLARLAARMQAAGLGDAELSFTREEVAEFVSGANHTDVSVDEADRWLRASHGWAAALVLTQEAGGPEDAPLGRSPRQLFGYLSNEVLGQLPASLETFLLRTSVLDTISPATADALLGATGSEANLHELANRLLFVQPHAGPPLGFTYHPLLREYLRTRLREEAPAEFERLYQRAGELAEGAASLDAAVTYYLQGGHHQYVARLLEHHGGELIRQGRWLALKSWFEALPHEFWEDSPALLLTYAQVLQRTGATDVALLHGQRAVALAKALRDTRLAATALVTLARVLGPRGEFEDADGLAKEALGLLPMSEPALRAAAHEVRGLCLRHLGKTGPALTELNLARRNAAETTDTARQAQVARSLASVYLATDDLERAEVHYRAAFTLWQQQGDTPLQAAALNGLGLVESRRGDYDASLRNFHRAHQLAVSARTHPQLEGLILRNMADDLRDQGRYDEALNTLAQAETLAKQCGDNWLLSGVYVSLADVQRVTGRLIEAERSAASALRWAKHVNSPQYIGMAAAAQGVLAMQREQPSAAIKHFTAAFKQLRKARTNRELARALLRGVLFHAHQQHDGLAEELAAELQKLADGTELGLTLVVEGAELLDLLRATVQRSIGGETLQGLLVRCEEWANRSRPASITSISPPEAWPGLPRIQAFGLGAARVLRGGEPVTTSQWGTTVARDMFFLLLLHPGGLRREQIIDLLWPESPGGRGVSQFHSTLHRLKRALGLDNVPREAQRYKLPADAGIWSDVAEFEQALKAAAQADGDPARVLPSLQRAVDLYTGAFLEDSHGEWAEEPREKLQSRYLRALLALAKAHDDRGEYDQSLECYERVLAIDNSLEEVHARVLQCHARLGEAALVREHYHRYADWLERELGAHPSPKLVKNYRQLVEELN